MNKEEFKKRIKLILEDQNCNKPSNEWLDLLFSRINIFSDDEINRGFAKILMMSQDDWNKKYGFGGKPAISDWLVFFGKKPELPLEQQAKIQVERIIEYAKGYPASKVIFDNKTTNAVVRDYGIGYIRNQLTNEWLDYAKGESTIRRELLDKWLNYHYDNQEHSDFVKISNDSNLIDMFGDKSICTQLLAQPKQIESKINTENQQKINLLISNIVRKNEKYN